MNMIGYSKNNCEGTGIYEEIKFSNRDDLVLDKKNQNESDYNKYGLLLKIVGMLFNNTQTKLDNDNRDYYHRNREIINCFEKIVSCIRTANMDIKDILKEDKDNLSVLINIGSALNLKQEFIKLLNNYLELMQIDELKFDIKKEDLPKEIEDIFTKDGGISDTKY